MNVLTVIIKALALAALVLVTGWAAWLLFHRRAAGEDNRYRNVFFSQVSAGVAVTGVAALILALTGAFAAWSLALFDIGLAVVALIVRRPRLEDLRASVPGGRNLREAAAPALIVLVALVIFVPPFMDVFGSWDVGGYANIAGNIRRTGSAFYTDPLLADMDPSTRDLFYEKYYRDDTGAYKYTILDQGFYITDASTGRVTPQFFYFFPAWLAAGMAFLGVRPGFLVQIFFAALSLWAFWVLAKELLGPKRWNLAALAASLFLVVNFLEVYFVKYATSEMLIQFLFVSGLLCHVLFAKARGRGVSGERSWWGFLSALFFGCLLLVHIEGFILVLPLLILYLGYFVKSGLARVTEDRAFLLVFAAFFTAGLALALGPYRIYATDIQRDMMKHVPGGWVAVGIGVLTLVVAAVIARRYGGPAVDYLRRHRSAVMWVLSAVFLAAVLYALFLRPVLSGQAGLSPDVRQYYESALPRLAYYLTPLGLALAASGFVLFLLKDADSKNAIVPVAGLVFAAVLIYRPFITPILVYSMRRYVPEVLPAVALMEGFALKWVYEGFKRSGWRPRQKEVVGATVCVTVALVLIGLSLAGSLKIWKLPEFRRSYPLTLEVSGLAGSDEDVVLLDEKAGRLLAAPLRSFLGRKVVRLVDNRLAADGGFVDFLKRNGEAGAGAYIVAVAEDDLLEHSERLDLEKVGTASINTRILEITRDRPKINVVPYDATLEVFRVTGIRP